jgi:phosphodiesterase/alkaline phosphatase D-like protein
MAITIGPIIGHVTGTSARVLFETNADGGVSVELRRGAAVAASTTVAMKRLVPGATTLTGLSPGVRYQLTIRALGDGDKREGSLRTPDTGGSAFRVAAVSCNQILQDVPESGWSRLAKRIKDQKAPIDVLLHLGDQVYGDAIRGHGKSTFTECVEYLSTAPRGRTSWPSLVPWVTEQYRALYRSWWSLPAVAEVLANVSNLMIWDDHEVSDDWGDDNKFADPKLPHHFVARGAWRAFHEYQRQLWDEAAASRPIGTPECFHQTIGDVGLFFLDLRGGRGFSIVSPRGAPC